MNVSTFAFAGVLALALGFGAPVTAAPQQGSAATSATASTQAAPQLHAAMRALWHGHIVNTRDYAIAVDANDAAAAKRAADATVANAKEIANAVAGFYGEDAGKQMLQLLAGHWQGVKDLSDARHANNDAGMAKARNELNANADAVARFLSGANPYLPEDTVKGLMMAHIGFHEAQINELAAGDRKAEAQTWDAMQKHMDMFADGLSDGIARQFPAKAK